MPLKVKKKPRYKSVWVSSILTGSPIFLFLYQTKLCLVKDLEPFNIKFPFSVVEHKFVYIYIYIYIYNKDCI